MWGLLTPERRVSHGGILVVGPLKERSEIKLIKTRVYTHKGNFASALSSSSTKIFLSGSHYLSIKVLTKSLYHCIEFPVSGCLIAGFLLMTEMATPKWRRWANCLSQVAYGVGIAVQALIAFFIRDWKPFSLVITLLNLPFIAYYW